MLGAMPASGPDRRLSGAKIAGWSAFGLAGGWFTWAAVSNLARHVEFEDQLIVLRYARNLVEGNGLVYNPGERIQGFTTPLFTLLSTVAVAIGGDEAAFWQNAFGVACIVGTAILAARILSRAGAAGASPLAVALIFYFPAAGSSALYLGMEVHLFTLLLLLALDLHLADRSTLAAVATGLLFLTRPEGVLLSAILLSHNWSTQRRPPYREAGAALLTVAPWLLFATVYYGTPLSTTLGAKRSLSSPLEYALGVAAYQGEKLGGLAAIWTGWEPSAATGLAGILMPIPVASAAIFGAIVLVSRRPQVWPLLTLPLAWLVSYSAIGAPVLHRWHYYFLHVLVAVLVSAGTYTCLRKVAGTIGRRLRRVGLPGAGPRIRGGRAPAATACAGVVLMTVPVLLATRNSFATAARIMPQIIDPRSVPGSWLRDRYDPDTSIYALEIGFLGWQSRLRVIDGAGLVTPGLRQHTPRVEMLERYLPDLVLLKTAEDDQGSRPWMYRRVREFDDLGSAYRLYSRVDPVFRYRPERNEQGRVTALIRNPTRGREESSTRIPVVAPGEVLGKLDLTAPGPADARTKPFGIAEFTLKGWAADTTRASAADTVVAIVGENDTATGTVALPRRPDVAAHIGREFEYSGFALQVAANRERIEREGVTVYAVSNRGLAARVAFSYLPLTRNDDKEILPTTDGRQLVVQPAIGQLAGTVERVTASKDRVFVAGWAADLQRGERPRQVVVYRDGKFLTVLPAGRTRNDVAERYRDERLANAGFAGSVPTASAAGAFSERHRVFAIMLQGVAVELVPAGNP